MQLEFFDVPSPCVGICQSDEKGHCLGCMRSRSERLEWKTFNNDEKQKVIKRCIQRKKRKKNQHKPKEKQPLAIQESDVDRQPSLLDPPSKTKIAPDTDLDFSEFEL
jgi:predicted Fe-S protein YdhL (DUF1289 family)